MALLENIRSAFSFMGEKVKPLKTFRVFNNLPYPGRCELAQKIGNLDRAESCMLKPETE